MLAAALLPTASSNAAQQWTPEKRGSDNITVVSHLPLGPARNVADIEIEQEMARPYAYVARMVYGDWGDKGMDIIDLHDPARPEVIYKWRIENQDLHAGNGAMDVKHFKWDGRYYVVQSVQFGRGGPDSDMGAVVLDVTGLPDPETVREVGRIRAPDQPGGFHNIFVYKHSNGPVLLFSVSLTGISGVSWGHTFTPSPDGRYVVAEAEYQYAPLRIFDLQPALDGEVSTNGAGSPGMRAFRRFLASA